MHNKITELRKLRGITQEELAQAVGSARQTIIALEAGRYNPSLRLAYDIACTLEAKYIEDVFSFD